MLVTSGAREVSAWVEDDYHHMGVTLHHDGTTIARVEAEMLRAPWSTCPGAVEQLRSTFTGAALEAATSRGEKTLNCTHLHDMALLAAAHARDAAPTMFRIVVTDAVDGVRTAELSRDGTPMLRIVERNGVVTQPVEADGKTLFELGEWIASLDKDKRESARLLRWSAIIAHGRAIPMAEQSDARRMPPTCFTFQEGRKESAKRVGAVLDFSLMDRKPLEEERASSFE
ncbi:MAG: DUF2889 domain-containing protein [Sphingomicrobium sp.]